jgi:hypothetical protein
MKMIITCLVGLVCASCATCPKQFAQGDIRIVPPVQRQKDATGGWSEYLYNDGGTRMFTITDAEGKTFDVYFDARLDLTNLQKATTFHYESIQDVLPREHRIHQQPIYLNGYPETSNSVRVIDQEVFRDRILNGIK